MYAVPTCIRYTSRTPGMHRTPTPDTHWTPATTHSCYPLPPIVPLSLVLMPPAPPCAPAPWPPGGPSACVSVAPVPVARGMLMTSASIIAWSLTGRGDMPLATKEGGTSLAAEGAHGRGVTGRHDEEVQGETEQGEGKRG